MKNVIILLVFLFVSITGFSQKHDFSWLVGSWKLQGKNVYEVWKHDGDVLRGESYKISDADTTVLEKITLREREGNYYYVPDVAENKGEVEFRMTSITADGFVAENAEHDFPRIIRYAIVRKDGVIVMNASIEGNGRVIHYAFNKVR